MSKVKGGRGPTEKEALDALKPYLVRYKIITTKKAAQELLSSVQTEDLRNLCRRWGIAFSQNTSRQDLIGVLMRHLNDRNMNSRRKAIVRRETQTITQLAKDYFGAKRTSWSTSTSDAMLYCCHMGVGMPGISSASSRGSDVADGSLEHRRHQAQHGDGLEVGSDDDDTYSEDEGGDNVAESEDSGRVLAKQKCSEALLRMSFNLSLEHQFIHDGGLKSMLDLAMTTSDPVVLSNCSACVAHLAGHDANARILMEMQILSVLGNILEHGTNECKFFCTLTLSNLTMHEGLEEPLLREGILIPLTSLISSPHAGTVRLATAALVNMAEYIVGSQAETVNRIMMQGMKRLASGPKNEAMVQFVASALASLSCLSHFRIFIAEEGAVGIIKGFISTTQNIDVIRASAVALSNVSLLRKGRREMVTKGVVAVLANLLQAGNDETKRLCTQVMLNLTRARDLRREIIAQGVVRTLTALYAFAGDDTLELATACLANFSSDSYCMPTVIREGSTMHLVQALVSERVVTQDRALRALANIVTKDEYVDGCIELGLLQPRIIVPLMDEPEHYPTLSRLLANLSCYARVRTRFITEIELLHVLLQLVEHGDASVRVTSMQALRNLAMEPASHKHMVENRLLSVLKVALEDEQLDVMHSAAVVLNALSMRDETIDYLAAENVGTILVQLCRAPSSQVQDLAAAVFYNVSLQRSVQGPGVVSSLVALCQSLRSPRVLWCTMTLANLSMFPKSRLALQKEKDMLSCLVGLMRSGSEEAEKVQHFCAITLCNVLAVYLKADSLQTIVESGFVEDLIVIAVLRVNSVKTKEVLARALCNLLSRQETRKLMCDHDVAGAIVRLGKISSRELRLMSVRTLYNLACKVEEFSSTLRSVEAVSVVVNQVLVANAGSEVKKLAGKALVGLAGDKDFVEDMLDVKICEAIYSVSTTKDDESNLHCAGTAYYLSFSDNCPVLSSTMLVPLLVTLAKKGSVVIRQLVVAAFANLSVHSVFHEQLTSNAIPLICDTLATAAYTYDLRTDAVSTVYNMVCVSDACRPGYVQRSIFDALQSYLKLLRDDEDKEVVARIVHEISKNESVRESMLGAGVMTLIHKLSKLESARAKLDVACAICNLSRCGMEQELLEEDVLDDIFWLTLQDCLRLNTPIYKRCAITIKHIALHPRARSKLVLEDKFLDVTRKFCEYVHEDVAFLGGSIFYNMVGDELCRTRLLKNGLVGTLMTMARRGEDRLTHMCSAALHSLPQDELLLDDPDIVQVLMSLLAVDDSTLQEAVNASENPVGDYDLPFNPQGTVHAYTGADLEADWRESLVDEPLPFHPADAIPTNSSSSVQSVSDNDASDGGAAVGEYAKLEAGHAERLSPQDVRVEQEVIEEEQERARVREEIRLERLSMLERRQQRRKSHSSMDSPITGRSLGGLSHTSGYTQSGSAYGDMSPDPAHHQHGEPSERPEVTDSDADSRQHPSPDGSARSGGGDVRIPMSPLSGSRRDAQGADPGEQQQQQGLSLPDIRQNSGRSRRGSQDSAVSTSSRPNSNSSSVRPDGQDSTLLVAQEDQGGEYTNEGANGVDTHSLRLSNNLEAEVAAAPRNDSRPPSVRDPLLHRAVQKAARGHSTGQPAPTPVLKEIYSRNLSQPNLAQTDGNVAQRRASGRGLYQSQSAAAIGQPSSAVGEKGKDKPMATSSFEGLTQRDRHVALHQMRDPMFTGAATDDAEPAPGSANVAGPRTAGQLSLRGGASTALGVGDMNIAGGSLSLSDTASSPTSTFGRALGDTGVDSDARSQSVDASSIHAEHDLLYSRPPGGREGGVLGNFLDTRKEHKKAKKKKKRGKRGLSRMPTSPAKAFNVTRRQTRDDLLARDYYVLIEEVRKLQGTRHQGQN